MTMSEGSFLRIWVRPRRMGEDILRREAKCVGEEVEVSIAGNRSCRALQMRIEPLIRI